MALKKVATAKFLKVRDTAVTWMGTWGSLQDYGDSPLGKSLQSACAVDLRRLPKKKNKTKTKTNNLAVSVGVG